MGVSVKRTYAGHQMGHRRRRALVYYDRTATPSVVLFPGRRRDTLPVRNALGSQGMEKRNI